VADQREAILSRLVTVCGAVAGINAADRNRLDVSGMLRPSVIVLDGAETVGLAALSDGRAATVSHKQLMELRPTIIIAVRGDSGGEAGSLLTLYRNRLLAAILTDAALIASVTSNGGIRYEGCIVPEPDAEAKEYRIDLSIVFTYRFQLDDLLP
jgi:hypothetical protein